MRHVKFKPCKEAVVKPEMVLDEVHVDHQGFMEERRVRGKISPSNGKKKKRNSFQATTELMEEVGKGGGRGIWRPIPLVAGLEGESRDPLG